MSNDSFVQFLNTSQSAAPSGRYDGYLSFIPPTTNDEALTPAHRYLFNPDFYWLEIKDNVPSAPIQLQIDTPTPCLWIHIDLSGRSILYTTGAQPLSTGEVICYRPHNNPFKAQLGEGKNWVFMIGIAPASFERLAGEYPLIQEWRDKLQQSDQNDILGKMTVHPKLFSVLEALKRINFRPFSTYYLLMAWNLRLFQIVFNEAKNAKVEEKKHSLKLYYDTLAYIRAHFDEEGLNLQKVAYAMHVTVRSLTRSFENRPHTVNELILELRLNEARDTITSSDATIVSIAFALHFNCQKSFSKLFKKRFGYSPTEYRERTKLKRPLVR